MAIGRVPHLMRRGATFYFRRALPDHLTDVFGCREIKRSLQTRDLSVARIRCRLLSNLFEQLLARAGEMPELTAKDIRELARTYFECEWAKASEVLYLAGDDSAFNPDQEAAAAKDEEGSLRTRAIQRAYDVKLKSDADELLSQRGYASGALSAEKLDELSPNPRLSDGCRYAAPN